MNCTAKPTFTSALFVKIITLSLTYVNTSIIIIYRFLFCNFFTVKNVTFKEAPFFVALPQKQKSRRAKLRPIIRLDRDLEKN